MSDEEGIGMIDRGEQNPPWMRVRDVPLLLAFLPFGLLLGFHLAFIAYGVYRVTKIPYLVSLFVLLALCLGPSLFFVPNPLNVWYLALSAVVFMTAAGIHLLFCEKENLRTGCNLEYVAAPHLILVNLYLLLPAFT